MAGRNNTYSCFLQIIYPHVHCMTILHRNTCSNNCLQHQSESAASTKHTSSACTRRNRVEETGTVYRQCTRSQASLLNIDILEPASAERTGQFAPIMRNSDTERLCIRKAMNQKVKNREASGARPAIQYTMHVKMLASSCTPTYHDASVILASGVWISKEIPLNTTSP